MVIFQRDVLIVHGRLETSEDNAATWLATLPLEVYGHSSSSLNSFKTYTLGRGVCMCVCDFVCWSSCTIAVWFSLLVNSKS